MSTETSSPVHTIASIVGLPQRGGRKGHIPQHRGHTVRRVRAALAAGASPAEILAMLPWGAHGSAFALDRSLFGPSSSSHQRVRVLVDGRSTVVVAVVHYNDVAHFAVGMWAFAADRARLGAKASERAALRATRRAAILTVPPAEREALRRVMLAQDRDALRESSAQRSAEEKAGAERVRAWWRDLSDADRKWARNSPYPGECVDTRRNVWDRATHPDGWRFDDGQEGGRVSFADEDRPDGRRVWHGAGRAIAEVEGQEAEDTPAQREARNALATASRWEDLAESARVHGGDA